MDEDLFLVRGEGSHFLVIIARKERAKIQLRHHLSQMDLAILEALDEGGSDDTGDLLFICSRGLEFPNTAFPRGYTERRKRYSHTRQ